MDTERLGLRSIVALIPRRTVGGSGRLSRRRITTHTLVCALSDSISFFLRATLWIPSWPVCVHHQPLKSLWGKNCSQCVNLPRQYEPGHVPGLPCDSEAFVLFSKKSSNWRTVVRSLWMNEVKRRSQDVLVIDFALLWRRAFAWQSSLSLESFHFFSTCATKSHRTMLGGKREWTHVKVT